MNDIASGPQPPATIRVQGHGSVSTAPDVVDLGLEIACEDRDYGRTIAGLNGRLESLRQAVADAGEDPKALKTGSFQVSIENDYEVRNRFRCFKGEHRLALRLPFEQGRLARVFASISGCDARPELSLSFGFSDPEAIRQRVLEDAVKNARKRAEIITAAAGQTLGRIVAIQYGYAEIRISSDVMESCELAKMESAPELEPSDIDSTDTVQIVWEITGGTSS